MGITIISIDTGIEVYNNIKLQYIPAERVVRVVRRRRRLECQVMICLYKRTLDSDDTMDNDNNTYHNIINAMFFLLGFRFRIDLRAGYMSLFIVVGNLTKEASRINGSVAQDYFNDDHMFARQITSKINAIP